MQLFPQKTQEDYVSLEEESATHRAWGQGQNTDKGWIERRMYGCFTFRLKSFPVGFKLFPNENEEE